MVQRVLDVPTPRQPDARTRGCMAGAGRREAGRSGRRWAGWAHQRAHGGIPTPPDKSLTRTYLSQRSPHTPRTPPPPHPAPRTPHPTPSTLYPIGFRGPRTLDTPRRGSVAKAGAQQRNFHFFFPGTQCPGTSTCPPVFSPTGSRFLLALYTIHKNKNRCFPTQSSPPHRNNVVCFSFLVHVHRNF